MSTSAFAVAVVALAVAGTASAQGTDASTVYRCKQASGTVTYQDYPCEGGVTVEIKPDAADPAAIARLQRAQAEFDRAYAQRRAAEAATIRPAPIVVPNAGVEPPYASEVPEYLLYGPIPPTRFERRERRERRDVRPIAVPERNPAIIRRPRAS